MGNNNTITSANSVFTIVVPGLYPSGVQLSGYSAERAWETADLVVTESQIGVDGRKTSGWVPNMPEQTISLQADSPAKPIFKAIYNMMVAQRDAVYISATIQLPSTGESFSCVKGTLKNYKPLPDGGKVLQPQNFSIEWESIQPTLI